MSTARFEVARNSLAKNTDGKGFLQSLREVVDPEGKQVVMFGAGGAARAIGVELALAGATCIIVVNRGESRGRTLVDLLNRKTKTEAEFVVQVDTYKIPTEADIVVKATSIGLYPDIDGRLNLDVESLRPSLIIADVILHPPRTRLVRDAEARGRRVLDGLGMIVNQGILGIKYWTGVDVEASVMRKNWRVFLRADGVVKVTTFRRRVARHNLPQVAVYAARARHSRNGAERLCL